MSILENIYKSTLKFLSPLSLEETYKIIIEEAIKLVNGDSGRIFLSNSKGGFDNVYSSSRETMLEPRRRGNVYKSFSQNKAFVAHAQEVAKTYPKYSQLGVRSIMYIPLTHDNITYGVITIRSKRDARFDEDQLSILKLFGSLASLAIRKAILYRQTKESLDTRDLFISLAAHELRTPLTTINGYAQLLLSKIRERKPIDKKWIMELALEGKRMETLINEFLEINRIKTGKLQYNWSENSIRKIIDHVIKNFRLNNPGRKLVYKSSLSKRSKDTIVSDFDKIFEVITNILENADKYSPANKKVSVTLKYNNPYFVLMVADQGQGISAKDLPSIFKGFYKGEKSKHEGMGLGLYLAKSIIDAHQGEIEIKSKETKGTKVIIKLPKMEAKK